MGIFYFRLDAGEMQAIDDHRSPILHHLVLQSRKMYACVREVGCEASERDSCGVDGSDGVKARSVAGFQFSQRDETFYVG